MEECCKKCNGQLNVEQGGFSSRDPAVWIDPICPHCGYDNLRIEWLGCVLYCLVVIGILAAIMIFAPR